MGTLLVEEQGFLCLKILSVVFSFLRRLGLFYRVKKLSKNIPRGALSNCSKLFLKKRFVTLNLNPLKGAIACQKLKRMCFLGNTFLMTCGILLGRRRRRWRRRREKGSENTLPPIPSLLRRRFIHVPRGQHTCVHRSGIRERPLPCAAFS